MIITGPTPPQDFILNNSPLPLLPSRQAPCLFTCFCFKSIFGTQAPKSTAQQLLAPFSALTFLLNYLACINMKMQEAVTWWIVPDSSGLASLTEIQIPSPPPPHLPAIPNVKVWAQMMSQISASPLVLVSSHENLLLSSDQFLSHWEGVERVPSSLYPSQLHFSYRFLFLFPIHLWLISLT